MSHTARGGGSGKGRYNDRSYGRHDDRHNYHNYDKRYQHGQHRYGPSSSSGYDESRDHKNHSNQNKSKIKQERK